MKTATALLLAATTMMFVSCEQTKQYANAARDQLQASATGSIGVLPNDEGGQEVKAEGSAGLFGYDVYGGAKLGFRKTPAPVTEVEVEPLPTK